MHEDTTHETRPACLDCNGYGTADGEPASLVTRLALAAPYCARCGGSGDEPVAEDIDDGIAEQVA
jgi:DnaJ-class molecular chaperone